MMTVFDELNDPKACERHLARLRETFPELGVGAFLVRDTSNIQWLTAFDDVFDEEAAHALYVCPDHAWLHTDSRYVTACENAARHKPLEVSAERETHAQFAAKLWGALSASAEKGESAGTGGATEEAAFAKSAEMYESSVQESCICADLAETGCGIRANAQILQEGAGSKRLGIEDGVSLAEYRRLQKAFAEADAEEPFVETDGVVVGLRAVKDRYEIARMRGAQSITDAAFEHIVRYMRSGMMERQVQLELEEFMLRHGAQGLAFPSIVATGPNGASPHAIPGATMLEAGQCVVLDFGARSYGYCSDMTRTVFLGEPDPEMRAAWDALREANESVEAMLRPGVTGKEAHERAEEVLAAAGFGGRMGHGLGHGVGIDIHEEPVLAPRNERPLVAGNVVTVEPGIYLPGKFGMRLEDFGVVTDTGFDVFTNSTHDLVVI